MPGIALPAFGRQAQEKPVLLDDHIERLALGGSGNLFYPSTALNFSELEKQQISGSDPALLAFFNPKSAPESADTVYFLRYQLKNTATSYKQWVLELDGYATLEVCLIREDGSVEIKTVSLTTPFSARDFLDRSPAIDLRLKAGETLTLIIRTKSLDTSYLIWQKKFYYAQLRTKDMLYGAYFGFFLILCFYNLFLFRVLKDESYLYYALHIIFFAIVQFTVTGYAFRFLWPEHPQYSLLAEGLFLCLTMIFGIQTIQSFLRITYVLPVAKPIMQVLTAGAIVFIPVCFLPGVWWDLPLSVLVLITSLVLLIIGIIVLIRGYRPARYYLTGWCLILIAIILFYLSKFEVLPEHFITRHGVKVAAVLNMMFISLGLNDRLRQERALQRRAKNKILNSWRAHAREQEANNNVLIKQNQELKQAYRDLEQSQETSFHLKELNELKSHFFANISHEFRTPLTLMMGALHKIIAERPEDAELRRIEQAITRNGQTLQQLISHLLDLSRLESGKLSLKAVKQDISSFLQNILSAFTALAEAKKITYTFQIPEYQQFVYIDPEQLEKIVSNLLSNAVKFTPEGGNIAVCVDINSLPTENVLELRVKDSGIGIPKDQQKFIFDRFYQVEQPYVRAYEGSGIGLALVKELVELHKGEIEVESEPGDGALFIIRLPLLLKDHETCEYTDSVAEVSSPTFVASPEESAVSVNTSPEIPQLSEIRTFADFDIKEKYKVLVVEDNQELRTFIKENLAPFFKMYEATNGLEGFEAAAQLIPDLVISDVMMPVKSGIDLCHSLKTDNRTSHIPLILLTARADHNSKLSGLNTGADDYLTKPFNPTELIIRVKNLIEQRQKLRQYFSKGLMLSADVGAAESLDAKFLKKVINLLEEHLDDPDFNVEKLSHEIALSKSQLYRKLLALTGQSPNIFIQKYRIRRAAEMLERNVVSVSEAAYSVGFVNLSYFSKCFRDLYGHAPSEHGRTSVKNAAKP